MIRTTDPKRKTRTLRSLICLNARAYNKYLTKEYLDGLGIRELLRYTHPIERMEFATKANQQGILSYSELSKMRSDERQRRLIRTKK